MEDYNKPFIFSKQITLRTRLFKSDVRRIIDDNTQEKYLFNFKAFRGTVSEDSFYLIQNKLFSKNMSRPYINGMIEEKDTGTFITITTGFSKAIYILFSILILIFLGCAIYNFFEGNVEDGIADLCIPILIYLVNVPFFCIEVNHGIKKIKKLLNAENLS